MKKVFAVFLASVMILSMTACGNESNGNAVILENPASDSSTDTDNSAVNSTSQDEEDSVLSAEENDIQNGNDSDDMANADTPSDINTTGSVVYMTTDISPEGMMAVYEALEWTPEGRVAVKLSTGEPPASNYLRPEFYMAVMGLFVLIGNYISQGMKWADRKNYAK